MHRLPPTQAKLHSDRILEEFTDLEAFIKDHDQNLQSIMNPDQGANQPDPKRRKRDSATDTNDLQTQEVEVSVLAIINKKLDMLVTIHEELNDMHLEFAHNQIETLHQSNQELQTSVTSLPQQMQNITAENKQMKAF